MSLINKMLDDLEKRQAYLADNQDTVLDGLCSATDTELGLKDNRRLIIILGIIIAISIVLLFVNPINFLEPENKSIPKLPVLPETGSSQVEQLTLAGSMETTVENDIHDIGDDIQAPGRINLKLDQELIIGVGDKTKPINSSGSALIEDITIETSGQVIIITLIMLEKAEYLVYTLDTPDRTVLEIANAGYTGLLPDISKMLNVSGVRKKLESDGTFRFIVETENEMFIESTNINKGESSFNLQITLKPQSQVVASETHDQIPPAIVTDSAINDATQPESGIVKKKVQQTRISEADRLYLEGRRLYQERQVAKSIDKLMAAVKLDIDHVEARLILANSLIEQGQRDLAYSTLREGLMMQPGQTQWARLLAQGLLDEGELSAAKDVLYASMPAVTDDSDYHAMYAAILQRLGLHKDAAETYRNILKLHPKNGIWWMGLAISLEAMSRIDDALFAYKNALKGQSLTPDTYQYINQRIRILNQHLLHEPT